MTICLVELPYHYYVTAVNAVGEGPQCSEESAYYTTSAPSYPIDITLNYISNSNAINVSWSLPTSDGGATISYYNVYRSTISGNEVFLAKAYSLTYIDTNVKNGQTYYYTVTAVNSIGEGSQSFQNYFTVPEVAPNAPQSLSLSASSGSITVSWSPPSNNGGETITGYDIYRGTTSGGETLLTTVSTTNYTDTNVENGQIYYYEVCAVNGVGSGSLSAEINTVAFVNPPSGINGYPLLGLFILMAVASVSVKIYHKTKINHI